MNLLLLPYHTQIWAGKISCIFRSAVLYQISDNSLYVNFLGRKSPGMPIWPRTKLDFTQESCRIKVFCVDKGYRMK